MKPKHTKEDPWARLDAMLAETKEPTGPEWFTMADFQCRYGIQYEKARRMLEKLTQEGKVERWIGHCKAARRQLAKYRLT